MYLKRLELSGFKSFGKKTTLDFTSPISVIVGPNGSGKSNTAEAMRFVLGEQSVKSMRGKRGEDLIFNGSESVPRAGRASVSVVFDNTKRQFNIDYDEVILERVVHRDGVNQYSINKSQVRLKDVVELLSSVHIGASSHHIISQGEADRILNASIKDRRSMVEDALGLKIYHYKKNESERRLIKTAENIKEIELLRKEIAPHLKFLHKQVEKVKQAEEMRKELKGLYVDYFQSEDLYIKKEKENITEEKKAPEGELRDLADKIDKSKKEIDEADKGSDKLDKILETERALQRARGEKSELSRKLGRLEGVIEYQRRLAETAGADEFNRESNGGSNSESDGVPKKKIDFSLVESLSEKIDEYIKEALLSEDIVFIKETFQKINKEISDFISVHGKEAVSEIPLKREVDIEKMEKEKIELEQNLEEKEEEENKLNIVYLQFKSEIEGEKDKLRSVERAMFEMMSKQGEVRSRLDAIKRKEESLGLLEDEFKRDLAEAGILLGREATNYDKDLKEPSSRDVQIDRKKKIERLRMRIEDYGGGSGEDVMREYEEVVARDEFLGRELDDLNKSREALEDLIKELTEKLDSEFREGVKKINKQFQEFFSLLFGGGSASLSLVAEKKKKRLDTDLSIDDSEILEDEEEDVREGLDINISIPNKKLKGLIMMSGGERALTSIALLFAMSQVNPPPFMILDETDAALDEANSRKYGDMIEALSKYSQLIVVTHNRETMARGGVLYGVTMGSDAVSRLLSIKFDEAEALAA